MKWQNAHYILIFARVAANKFQSGGSWSKVSDASSWSGIVMKASDSSLNDGVLFGPYITTGWDGESMLGRPYTVTFRLKVSSNLSDGDVACIDVGYNGDSVLKSRKVKASDFASSDAWQDFQLTFIVPNSIFSGLESRDLNNGVSNVFVDSVLVEASEH